MKQEDIERMYQAGKMPAWAYYQQIDKPLDVKWQEQRQAFLSSLLDDDKTQEQVEQVVEDAVLKILDDLPPN